MEERNRLLQVESILKGEDERVSRLGARPARPSVPSVPRPKAKPRCAERAVTPPPPTMRIPHWRNDRPSWNRSPERRAPGPGPGPAGSSQSRYAPQERSSAGLTGRTTPPKPKMGRSTPPRPRAVPKVSPRSGADGVLMRGTPPAPSFPATARGLTSSIREAPRFASLEKAFWESVSDFRLLGVNSGQARAALGAFGQCLAPSWRSAYAKDRGRQGASAANAVPTKLRSTPPAPSSRQIWDSDGSIVGSGVGALGLRDGGREGERKNQYPPRRRQWLQKRTRGAEMRPRLCCVSCTGRHFTVQAKRLGFAGIVLAMREGKHDTRGAWADMGWKEPED